MLRVLIMSEIRPAAVGGLFYPGEPQALAAEVDQLLAEVGAEELPPRPPKAVIAPHAGYIYSGPIAARAFAAVRALAGRVRRVVLLGPAHRVAIRGLALPGADGLATPLGVVAVDREAARAAASLPFVSVRPDAHAEEHALEVELPFLQRTLGEFEVLPLVCGHARPEAVAELLENFWDGGETLIVVSSDLSHYLPYGEAQRVDRETARAILDLAGPLDSFQACGALPISGLLQAARRHRLEPRLLDLRSSGDTAGDRQRVVGYAAFAFCEP